MVLAICELALTLFLISCELTQFCFCYINRKEIIIMDNYLGYCPVECDPEDEMWCVGPEDFNLGKQIGPDFCIPRKNGNCYNMCPEYCIENMKNCPGGMDNYGCPMRDFCVPIDSKSII